MKTSLFLIFFTLIFFMGCVNKRGVSATYYNDCKEYYDYQGVYHKACDDNVIEYKEVKEQFIKPPDNSKKKVW